MKNLTARPLLLLVALLAAAASFTPAAWAADDDALVDLGEMTWTVDRVTADGGARCTMTLDWMSVVTAGDEATRVDSRKSASADAKVMHGLLKAMAGAPLEVVVAPDGRVTQVNRRPAAAGHRRQLAGGLPLETRPGSRR